MAGKTHPSRLTLDRREEVEAEKLQVAKQFLVRVRNELNPDGFTIDEINDEFGSASEETSNELAERIGLKKQPTTGEVFRVHLAVLVEYKYVEKTGRGKGAVYSLTEKGRDYEEE